ncbi:MAG: hypothetical protein A2428_07725 [Bdellovibrionales bacterium RIFOXYC1_FULL_54_43]|nr:MAG: hypothetical protein A2428_07725 [Bdellovibrionales bacterium RIFOXYC1_FULL_54_43]OFZ79523.1 MAG: hypothetical protein A2603_09950 [Bdellovibrionales bacterium RIFOXYD1_FULL_55_31]
MNKTIYEYKSYKRYLIDLISAQPKRGRGFRTSLAEAASCQMAYISQVLGGERHFTYEQAEGINAFLGHSEDEARMFLLLVSYERAGTSALRTRYEKEMNREVQRNLTLKERFKAKEILSRELQATYYSSWYYAAVHIALTIPSLRTKEALARNFELRLPTVVKVLEFLTSVGLAEHRGNEYFPGLANIYVGNDSPLITQHHTNWRMRAIASLDPHNVWDLHYSAVVSIPKADFDKLKALFVKTIEEARRHWTEAKNEDQLCAVSVDWFRVGKE